MTVVECFKCGGCGRLDWASHYANGVCFACGGSGKVRTQHQSFQRVIDRFRTSTIWHQAIATAECMTPKGQVFLNLQGRRAFISLRLAGKARDRQLARVEVNSTEDLRSVWTQARKLADESAVTFVPYIYGDTSNLELDCMENIKAACVRWVHSHAPRFGLPADAIDKLKSYVGA